MYRKLVVAVYEGERLLGEAEVHPRDGVMFGEEVRVIRVSHYSPPSERCPPLAVLHTVNPAGICFKLESAGRNQDSPLSHLHSACLRENKTAVVSVRGEEIHLVAMHSRKCEEQVPCFWGFKAASSVYNSCRVMLNLRCLGIVFDLDETLIVANTMRSFEDRIEALQRRITSEYDPQRISGIMAEIKRYQDDKNILKQYAESDQVIGNGKIIKSQSEVVPSLTDSHPSITRPVIRLQDRNIILTRINPLIRDTSVLVRLRPAWEDFRSYLTARGRKRFEVFVCTMAERDYALEMWRLLDPKSNLINTRELLDRIVCVKSGSRKSLFNVFRDRNCHPKMALVIDDRLKVWDERDQPRIHVVPPFAPYYAPQAEANNIVPVLCVARNVACNVRGSFFKEFDDGLLQQISKVAYEDETKDVLSTPDVSNYLVSDEDPVASIGNKHSLGHDGMADPEVERKLKEANSSTSSSPAIMNSDPRIAQVLQHIVHSSSFTIPAPTIQGPEIPFPSQQLSQISTFKPPLAQVEQVDSVLHSSSATEEGEVPESELDPDTRRRLLILQHGQDTREQPPTESKVPARSSMEVFAPRVQPQTCFPLEEKINSRHPNQVGQSKEFPSPADPLLNETSWAYHPPLHKVKPSVAPGRALIESHRSPKEALPREEQSKFDQPPFNTHYFSTNKDPDLEAGQIDSYVEIYTEALHDIAFKCGTKVEFKETLVSSSELQFLVEVKFAGEKIGQGVGRTRREAQRQAAEGSLLNLADKYLSQCRPDSGYIPVNNPKGNGSIIETISLGYQTSPKDASPQKMVAGPPRNLDPRTEASKKPLGPIANLQELCMMEGFSVSFQTQPQVSANPGPQSEMYAQVEINGQILGKGIGQTWDEAKSQAAEKAIVAVKSMLGEFPYRHRGSPRSIQGFSNKRARQDFSRAPWM